MQRKLSKPPANESSIKRVVVDFGVVNNSLVPRCKLVVVHSYAAVCFFTTAESSLLPIVLSVIPAIFDCTFMIAVHRSRESIILEDGLFIPHNSDEHCNHKIIIL